MFTNFRDSERIQCLFHSHLHVTSMPVLLQVTYPGVGRGTVCELLKNHLFGNIVQVHG